MNLENDSDTITLTDDNTVNVKSTGISTLYDDVTIKFTFNGSEVCQHQLTVWAPNLAVQIGSIEDSSWDNGYKSVGTFEVKDQFNTVVPYAMPVNEKYENWASDYEGENWPDITPNAGTCIQFTDTWGIAGGGLTPTPQNPQNGTTKVDHADQTYRAGSLTIGVGREVRTHKFQSYRDHARPE